MAVPSIRDREAFEPWSDDVIHSLYDLDLERYGLPAFTDRIAVRRRIERQRVAVPPVVMRDGGERFRSRLARSRHTDGEFRCHAVEMGGGFLGAGHLFGVAPVAGPSRHGDVHRMESVF